MLLRQRERSGFESESIHWALRGAVCKSAPAGDPTGAVSAKVVAVYGVYYALLNRYWVPEETQHMWGTSLTCRMNENSSDGAESAQRSSRSRDDSAQQTSAQSTHPDGGTSEQKEGTAQDRLPFKSDNKIAPESRKQRRRRERRREGSEAREIIVGPEGKKNQHGAPKGSETEGQPAATPSPTSALAEEKLEASEVQIFSLNTELLGSYRVASDATLSQLRTQIEAAAKKEGQPKPRFCFYDLQAKQRVHNEAQQKVSKIPAIVVGNETSLMSILAQSTITGEKSIRPGRNTMTFQVRNLV